MADNRPEIGFIFEVDDRASQKLDRIADQMDRINRAQQGIAGGGARVGGLADQYRDGPTAGSPSGGAAGGTATGQRQGFQYQQWSNDPEVRRMQQESDARLAQERMRYANNQFVGNTPYMQDIAKSPAFSDRDFDRELIRHKEHLRENEERQMKNEKDYSDRRVERMKEWEQREDNRHANQIKRDRIRVQEFEDSQKRLTKHMYGSNFLGEFFAELGFVIFEQFQQGVQEYSADIDAEGFQYSGAGGELAGARRFQSRFGDFQRGMGEAVVAVGGALEDTFGTLFESGETTSQREFIEGIGRTREELERIAGIERTDGMSALSALLQQIDKDKLDPGALGAAVDELQRLGTLGLAGPGAVGLGHAQHAIITGGLDELQNLSENMDWERMILGGGTDPAQLNQGGWADDPRFREARAEKWLNLQTQMNEKRYNPDSGDLDKYIGQIDNIARAMQEAGLLTDKWAGGTIALHAAIVETTGDTKLADRVVQDYTAAQEANNQRMVDAAKVSAEATKEYDIFTRGMKRGQDEVLDLDYAMMEFEKTLGDNTNQLQDNSRSSQEYREEIDQIRMSLGEFRLDSSDDLKVRLAAHLNGSIPLSPQDLDELDAKLRRLGEMDSKQVDMIYNFKMNYSAVGAAEAQLAGIGAGFGDPLADIGQSWMLNIGKTPTTSTSTGSGFGRSSGGGGSNKKTASQAWTEARIKLLQEGATEVEVNDLEAAFKAQYDLEEHEKTYDKPGYLTAYDYGVKQIKDRVEADEDLADRTQTASEKWADLETELMLKGVSMDELAQLRPAWMKDQSLTNESSAVNNLGQTEAEAMIYKFEERFEAQEEAEQKQEEASEEAQEVLEEIDERINDLKELQKHNSQTLDDWNLGPTLQDQIEKLEGQRDLLANQVDQGIVTHESIETISAKADRYGIGAETILGHIGVEVKNVGDQILKQTIELKSAFSKGSATEAFATFMAGNQDQTANAVSIGLKFESKFAETALNNAIASGNQEEISAAHQRLAEALAKERAHINEQRAEREAAEGDAEPDYSGHTGAYWEGWDHDASKSDDTVGPTTQLTKEPVPYEPTTPTASQFQQQWNKTSATTTPGNELDITIEVMKVYLDLNGETFEGKVTETIIEEQA